MPIKKAGTRNSFLPGKPGTRKQLLPLLPFGPDGVSSVSATRLRLMIKKKWRRGEDLNLRYPLRYTHFPGVRLKPDSATSPHSGELFLSQGDFLWQGKNNPLRNRFYRCIRSARNNGWLRHEHKIPRPIKPQKATHICPASRFYVCAALLL